MPRALTVSQKEFLALVARVDDEAEQVGAYRELHLQNWESDDGCVTRAIRKLIKRPDAATVLRSYRMQRAMVVRQDLLKADHALGQSLIDAETMHQDALNNLHSLAVQATERFENDKTGRVSAKTALGAWDLVRKATATQSGTKGLTEEQALAIVEEKLKAREKTPTSVPVTLPRPLEPTRPAADSGRQMAHLHDSEHIGEA